MTAAVVDVDRAVLACVVDPGTNLVDARERLDCWLWDRPEVADFLDVVLVPGGSLPSASFELVLAAAGPLLPGDEEAAREQVALVVVAPAADVLGFAEAVQARGPLGAVVLTLAEHDDPVAAVAATCAHVLDLASRQVLPALTHHLEETTVTDPVPAPYVVDEGPAPVPVPVLVPRPAPAPVAPVRLLYVVWLGQTPHPGRRRAQRRWVERVLDTVAERSGDHVVRLVGLGNGLSDQSELAPAAEFRSVRRLRRRQHGWPRVQGVLDLARAGHDLDTLLERDLERVAYEGLPVLDRSVVVVVGEAPVAGQGVADAFAGLAGSVRLLWVAPERPALALPTMFEAPPGAERLTEHRELDEEVVRKLGLRPRSSLGERLDGSD